MIKEHEFNTLWYGKKAGIVTNVDFFTLPLKEQDELLSLYDWVEFRSRLGGKLPLTEMNRIGFYQVSTELRCRINLQRLKPTENTELLTIRTAEETEFRIDPNQIATFMHSRHYYLPGMTSAKINERFSLFGNRIIDSDPGRCLQILLNGEVQGWFLSERIKEGLNLTLSMVHRKTQIMGHVLYHKALLTYGSWNDKVGHTAFSESNTAVHNIYSSLGARFDNPEGFWLRLKP